MFGKTDAGAALRTTPTSPEAENRYEKQLKTLGST